MPKCTDCNIKKARASKLKAIEAAKKAVLYNGESYVVYARGYCDYSFMSKADAEADNIIYQDEISL